MKDCEYCQPDADGYVKPIEKKRPCFYLSGDVRALAASYQAKG